MLARYNGTCKACGKAIEIGQEITWNRAIKGSTRHAACSVFGIGTGVAETGADLARKALEASISGVDAAIAKHVEGFDGIEYPKTEAKLDVIDAASKASIPNCPNCNGERELNGNGGYTCFFCGHESESAKVEDKPKRTRKPKVEIVAKVSDALSSLAQNAAWYQVLTAILPHVSRVLLVGPPATGKSTTAMKVAGCKYRVTMTETTSREDLIGMFHLIDGETKWIDGPVTSAMRNGEPILVDEVDRYSPEAASLLYALIDDMPHLSLPNGDMLYAKDGYKMIMTSNEGLDTLPVAVQDRIECILMASEPHEDAISGLPEALRNVTTLYYRSLTKVSIKLPTTVRRMKTLNLLLVNGLNSRLAASIVFGQHAEILSVLSSMENSVR